jgi:hypothetical protein
MDRKQRIESLFKSLMNEFEEWKDDLTQREELLMQLKEIGIEFRKNLTTLFYLTKSSK